MPEISDENLDNIINNDEAETNNNEEVEPIKRGRGRPKHKTN